MSAACATAANAVDPTMVAVATTVFSVHQALERNDRERWKKNRRIIRNLHTLIRPERSMVEVYIRIDGLKPLVDGLSKRERRAARATLRLFCESAPDPFPEQRNRLLRAIPKLPVGEVRLIVAGAALCATDKLKHALVLLPTDDAWGLVIAEAVWYADWWLQIVDEIERRRPGLIADEALFRDLVADVDS